MATLKKVFDSDPPTYIGIYSDPIAIKAYNNALDDILAVLKEGVERKKREDKGQYSIVVNTPETDGYNQALKDVEALLQATLGEGKEINSIFKE